MHVLNKLQSISSIPFVNEIIGISTKVVPPSYISPGFGLFISKFDSLDASDNIGTLFNLKRLLILDYSQKKAISNAFRNQVSLIQGPPGTGYIYIHLENHIVVL